MNRDESSCNLSDCSNESKHMKGILVLSVALNLVAFGAVAYLVANKPKPETVAAVKPSESSSPANLPSRTKGKPGSLMATTNTITQKIDWRIVESEDYRQYIVNLRAIGCPEETIRDIIIADVNKLFEARRKEMRSTSTNKFEFWKAGNMFASMLDEEKVKQKQAMAKEKKELLTALLGSAPEEKADLGMLVNPFQDMLDFLPDGKQGQVVDLLQTFQAKMMKSMKDGAPDAEDMKGMGKIQKEMDAELAKILSPQELEDYQLRLSQTAMMMRMQLASFDPNEKEFRDIFKLKKQFDDEYGLMAAMDDSKKRKDAQKEMDAQMKQILGDDRYADYERTQDYAYQGIAKVVARQGLPKETGIKVFDMKKTAEDEARKVRADKALSADQRTAALEGIRAETERSIIETMGQKGYDSYKKSAYWLNSISPSKTAPK
ncbi:MAG: hypothetical protein JWM68_4106 [Verrucomicrobiales bacterium]|nr:hypothetical protein [Verrucomicrobiales bacterium]